MPNLINPYAFEEFPRAPLVFNINRRRVLNDVAEALHVFSNESQANPSRRLSDLGVLTDAQLAAIVPEVFSDRQISLRDGFVWGKTAQSSEPARLFPADSPALTAFNLFNGINSIVEVSRQVAQQAGWTPERSFAYARGLFLWLVQARVCQPKGTRA